MAAGALLRYAGRRLCLAVPTLLLVATAAFLLAHLAPGSPAAALAGDHGAPGYAAAIEKLHGLDRPLIDIYADWLRKIVSGDLGRSYRSGEPVVALIAARLPATLVLMLPAILLSTLIGTWIGLAAAAGKGRATIAGMAALHALPSYVAAQILVLVFARGAGLLPVQGLEDARLVDPGGLARLVDWARHLILPVITLSLHHLTFVAILTRGRVASEATRPYAVTALAKGLTPARVRRRHLLPNALLPLVTLLGTRFGAIIGGTLVVETVFALPGLGRLAVSAAIARDHPVVIGIVVLACAAIVFVNLVVDIAYRVLDPRVEGTR